MYIGRKIGHQENRAAKERQALLEQYGKPYDYSKGRK
jgi:hypothetical protein